MERLAVGRIVKPHGIRGEVSVDVYSQSPDRFARGSKMRAGANDVVIANARPHQGRMLVLFEQVRDRNDAEGLRGIELTIEATEAAPLPNGSYYPHELEGFDVVDGSGSPLGTLARVEEGPANDIWVVANGAREVLVPAVHQIVIAVDTASRRITVDPPEGLFG